MIDILREKREEEFDLSEVLKSGVDLDQSIGDKTWQWIQKSGGLTLWRKQSAAL
jgi:hypothetical protein